MRFFEDPYNFMREIVQKTLKEHTKEINGKIIDFGCGDKVYKSIFNYTKYIGIDINKRSKADIITDVMNSSIKGNIFDSAVSIVCIEHICEPEKMIKEMHRVLKKGGKSLIIAPAISRIHGAPHDYFRFTKYGLEYLLEKNGFKVIKCIGIGGFLLSITYYSVFFLSDKNRVINRILISILIKIYRFFSVFDIDDNFSFAYLVIGEKK